MHVSISSGRSSDSGIFTISHLPASISLAVIFEIRLLRYSGATVRDFHPTSLFSCISWADASRPARRHLTILKLSSLRSGPGRSKSLGPLDNFIIAQAWRILNPKPKGISIGTQPCRSYPLSNLVDTCRNLMTDWGWVLSFFRATLNLQLNIVMMTSSQNTPDPPVRSGVFSTLMPYQKLVPFSCNRRQTNLYLPVTFHLNKL